MFYVAVAARPAHPAVLEAQAGPSELRTGVDGQPLQARCAMLTTLGDIGQADQIPFGVKELADN